MQCVNYIYQTNSFLKHLTANSVYEFKNLVGILQKAIYCCIVFLLCNIIQFTHEHFCGVLR